MRLGIGDDGANEEAVELVPEKWKEAETNRFPESGHTVWGTEITRVAEERFACYPLAAGRGQNPRCWLPRFARN